MNAPKLVVSMAAAIALVGATGFAFAQSTTSPQSPTQAATDAAGTSNPQSSGITSKSADAMKRDADGTNKGMAGTTSSMMPATTPSTPSTPMDNTIINERAARPDRN